MTGRPLSREGTLSYDPDYGIALAPVPADYGLLSWTFDAALGAVGGSNVAAGILHLDGVWFRRAVTVENLWLLINSIAGGTLAHSFAGIYSAAGSLLTGCSDQSTSWQSTGWKEVGLTTAQTLLGFYWFGYLIGSAVTLPTFGRLTAGQAANFGSLTGNARRNADYGSSQTALPSTLTLSSLADSTRSTWWGIS